MHTVYSIPDSFIYYYIMAILTMMHFTHSTSNKANPFKRHRTLTSISSLKKKEGICTYMSGNPSLSTLFLKGKSAEI